MFTTSTHVKLDDCEKVTFNVMISKRAPLFPTPSHRQQSTHEVLKRLTSFNPTQLAESLVVVEVSGVLCEKFLHSPNDDDDGTVSFGVGSNVKLETVGVPERTGIELFTLGIKSTPPARMKSKFMCSG